MDSKNYTPETQETTSLTQNTTISADGKTIIIQQAPGWNWLGTAGFVLAIIGMFLFWFPVIGWILWVLWGIFSGIGLIKTPRWLAIAGLIISAVTLLVYWKMILALLHITQALSSVIVG